MRCLALLCLKQPRYPPLSSFTRGVFGLTSCADVPITFVPGYRDAGGAKLDFPCCPPGQIYIDRFRNY